MSETARIFNIAIADPLKNEDVSSYVSRVLIPVSTPFQVNLLYAYAVAQEITLGLEMAAKGKRGDKERLAELFDMHSLQSFQAAFAANPTSRQEIEALSPDEFQTQQAKLMQSAEEIRLQPQTRRRVEKTMNNTMRRLAQYSATEESQTRSELHSNWAWRLLSNLPGKFGESIKESLMQVETDRIDERIGTVREIESMLNVYMQQLREQEGLGILWTRELPPFLLQRFDELGIPSIFISLILDQVIYNYYDPANSPFNKTEKIEE